MDSFGWPEIWLSTATKTMISVNYKMYFTYSPFLMKIFGLDLWHWGLILTLPEILIAIFSLAAVLVYRWPPNKVNSFLMLLVALTSIWQPLGIWFVHDMNTFYWILANRFVFGLGFAILNVTIGSVIGSFTCESIRGKATGLVEFSWTLADYVLPLIGVLLRTTPISTTYYIQAGVGLLVAAMIYVRFPKQRKYLAKSVYLVAKISEETSLLVTERSDDVKRLGIVETLKKRKVIGICIWAVLSTSYMLMFSFFGIWLEEEYGLDSDKVGLYYFFSFTIAETISFIYMSVLSDIVGLLRSSYSMAVVTVIAGLIFGAFSAYMSLNVSLFMVALFIFSWEIMFVSIMAYCTTIAVSKDPYIMSIIRWTAIGAGGVLWVAVGPALWKYVGRLIVIYPSLPISQYGGVFLVMTVSILLGMVIMRLGQQSFFPENEQKLISQGNRMLQNPKTAFG